MSWLLPLIRVLALTQERGKIATFVSVLTTNRNSFIRRRRDDKTNLYGNSQFSATVLKGLLSDDRYEIVAVVTQPDRAVGRKKSYPENPS